MREIIKEDLKHEGLSGDGAEDRTLWRIAIE